MKNLPLSYIELSRNNLIHNIRQFRSILEPTTKIVAVLKGNAYGHGQNDVAKILKPLVDCFFVNSAEEFKLLRTITSKKIVLFGYVEISELSVLMNLGVVLSVFSIQQLKEINKIAKKLKIEQEIHIPIDANFGREGFLESELPDLFSEVKKSKYIKPTGLYAHFANREEAEGSKHAEKQIFKFEKAIEIAERFGFSNLQTHISATSGILRYETTLPHGADKKNKSPMVRLGKGIYGLWPSEYLKSLYKNSKFSLKPVLSWKTKIAQIKILPKGSTVGYGLTYKAKKEIKIAVIPQGYSNGLDRGLSNTGEMLIGGTRCKILGRVMMNMSVVDISHLKNVKIEDEVVILGRQGKEEITAKEMADILGTITYEITTRISSLLPRVIV